MLSSAVRGFKALGRICSIKNNNLLNRTIISSLALNTRQYTDSKKTDPLLKYDDDEIDDGDDDTGPDFDQEEDDETHEVTSVPHNAVPVPPVSTPVRPPPRSTEQRSTSEETGNNRPKENYRNNKGKGSVFKNEDREQWYQDNKSRLEKQKQQSTVSEREGNLRKRKVAIWCATD